MTLSTLIRKGGLAQIATATVATVATQEPATPATATATPATLATQEANKTGTVATVAVAERENATATVATPATPATHEVVKAGTVAADIADSAYSDSKQTQEESKLLAALANACKGLDITPAEVNEALAPEDIDDWRNGAISVKTLAAFSRSLVQRREMDQGKRPEHYTEQATCKRCGPVWLWFSGDVLGCPWCRNRAEDKPIPRPCSVRCGDCIHFKRTEHLRLGFCAKGESEPVTVDRQVTRMGTG